MPIKQMRKNFGISLPPDELALLDRLAAEQKRNRSQMIAWLVWEYAKTQGVALSPASRPQAEAVSTTRL